MRFYLERDGQTSGCDLGKVPEALTYIDLTYSYTGFDWSGDGSITTIEVGARNLIDEYPMPDGAFGAGIELALHDLEAGCCSLEFVTSSIIESMADYALTVSILNRDCSKASPCRGFCAFKPLELIVF